MWRLRRRMEPSGSGARRASLIVLAFSLDYARGPLRAPSAFARSAERGIKPSPGDGKHRDVDGPAEVPGCEK